MNFRTAIAVVAIGLQVAVSSLFAASRPNVVVILTDDQGYADIGINPYHPKEVATPYMDALAKEGIVFRQAYTSGHVCSPTRAGLMIGGYSQRVGVYTAGDGGRGFDPKRKIFPSYLPEEYVCGAIGKWHLGLDEDYPELKWHALNRGFDECYKFMGRGGHSYFDLRSDSTAKFAHPIYRNKERIDDEGYLTNRLTEEAVDFIDRHKAEPFFLYLAYNAVHAPAEAPDEDIAAMQAKYPGLSKERAILMAMLKHLDDGVGAVVKKLKDEGLFEDTILFFLTDNGGAKGMQANNRPLRGYKSSLDEGGIRTPFVVSWPKRFEGGRVVDVPVISFDILPTALDATGQEVEEQFDGKSLLPLLTGTTSSHHDTLFWSKGKEDEWAVRQGDWKLHYRRGEKELINLEKDPSERQDLQEWNARKVSQLEDAYDSWIEKMAPPITGGPKRIDVQEGAFARKTVDQIDKKKAREEQKRKRQQERKQQKAAESNPGTQPTAAVDDVDSSTLDGKLMVGYQGWFNCEGDGANLGWKHWSRHRKTFEPGTATVDLWPDVSELSSDERYETGFRFADGSPAEVFSSANAKTVATHFRWMREYGIDGAFVQCFANQLSNEARLANVNRVLSHVRDGARQHGRTFAVMYDLSGMKAGQVSRVYDDWMKLVGEEKVTSDPGYLNHKGRPLVAVWGVGFGDDRDYTPQECFDLVNRLKESGASVMLGIPSYWREGRRDAIKDPLLIETIKLADVVSPWTVGRYRDPAGARRHAAKVWKPDLEWCKEKGIDFLPVVFPGFSWKNLKGQEQKVIPRLKGEFFWSQITSAANVGCGMIYVAMFDEVDEGTAIFKCTNQPPVGEGVYFSTYEGLPNDHYLQLAGKAARLLRKQEKSKKDASKKEMKR